MLHLAPIKIDPTHPKAEHKALLRQLLNNFKHDSSKVLSKRKQYDVVHEGKTVSVQLAHSISKPYMTTLLDTNDPVQNASSTKANEFYIRTKEILGKGGFGQVKRACYRIDLIGDDIAILPGVMVYKRMAFAPYFVYRLQKLMKEQAHKIQDEKKRNEIIKEVKLLTQEFKKKKITIEEFVDDISAINQKLHLITNDEFLDTIKAGGFNKLNPIANIPQLIAGYLNQYQFLIKHEVEMLNKRYPNLKVVVISKNEVPTSSGKEEMNSSSDYTYPEIKLSDLDLHFSAHYFMPYIPGKMLLKDEGIASTAITYHMSVAKKLSYMRQVCRELDQIHRLYHVVHGDVKSENIIVTKHHQLRLIDLGLSDDLESKLSFQTGTDRYMAPEVFDAPTKNHILTGQEDVYSCGLVFYEIMTGEDGWIKFNKETRQYSIDGNALTLYNDNHPVSKFLFSIFCNFTAKDPADRFTPYQAEILFGLLSSQLCHQFLKGNVKQRLNIKEYKLQDLYYFNALLQNETDCKRLEKFLGDDLTGLFSLLRTQKDAVEAAYVKKITEQVSKLIDEIGANKTGDLKAFISQRFSIDQLDQLAGYIEKILAQSIDTQAGKRTGSLTIAKILKIIDPFILEQISPAVIEKAHEIKAGLIMGAVKSIFGSKAAKPEVETLVSPDKSEVKPNKL